MEKYLDIFFFQIIYTLVTTRKKFPYFSHCDMFIRNILGLREKDNNNYYTYSYNKKKYYIPQKLFFPKINDFGMTNLNKDIHGSKLYKSSIKDMYNIILDVYNGSGLGGNSLTELCKDDEHKIKFIKSYFKTYFDVKIIDEYMEESKDMIDWSWNNVLDKDYAKNIGIKDPEELLENYFFKIFGKINENIGKFNDKN